MYSIFNPRQVALITTKGREKIGISRDLREDVVTIIWHTPLSINPLMYAIVLGKKHFSTQLIQDSKCFAVNFMPASAKDVVAFCGKHSGRDIDKFKSCCLARFPCKRIDCSRLSSAVAYLECQVLSEVDVGDHILFIGKVLHSETFSNEKRLYHSCDDAFTTTLD